MSDITDDDFNYDAFAQWAFEQLRSGRCMIVACSEHKSYEGPTAQNEECRKCFKERTGKP